MVAGKNLMRHQPYDKKERTADNMKKDNFEDDGRTICSMDDLDTISVSPFRISRKQRKTDKAAIKEKIEQGESLTRSEYRRFTWYSILAALTVMGIIGGGAILFILLLLQLWK